MYLIDTSVVLPCLWQTTKPSHLKLLENLSEEEVPSLSVITYFEVMAGTTDAFYEANGNFLNSFRLIEMNRDIARTAGRLFHSWSRKGSVLPANDLLIGASAVTESLVLVTKNLKHFPYLDRYDEVKIEYRSRRGRKSSDLVYFLRRS